MTSKFTINDIRIISCWSYNLRANTDCTICRCNLNCPSLYNQAKGLDSVVVEGICDHAFHYDCIKPWIDKNPRCPLCSSVWAYKKPISLDSAK